jgi:hypothetical protein
MKKLVLRAPVIDDQEWKYERRVESADERSDGWEIMFMGASVGLEGG